jgi:putative ABC transport system substrate-binding protein
MDRGPQRKDRHPDRRRCRSVSHPCRRIGRARVGRYISRYHSRRCGGATRHPHRASRFRIVFDPVSAGFVSNLARPGGNTTGFALPEYGTSVKWLELLKEIAPGVTRVAVVRDPALVSGTGQLAAIQAVAPSFSVDLNPVDARDPTEMERAIAAFVRSANGGLIVTASPASVTHRKLIIALAARQRLPAVYAFRFMAADGGLISYGPNSIDPYRRAATYVDRILKGEKPGDLPVQVPTKYELVVNLKTAKALGFEVPTTVLARADEVIE